MQHKQLFNPEFSEVFEVGKDVEYLTDIEYASEKRKSLVMFFNYMTNKNVLTYNAYMELSEVSQIIKQYIYNDYSIRDLFSDFINVLKIYTKKLENNKDLYDELTNLFKKDYKELYNFLTLLQNNGIDIHEYSVKALKSIIKDLENRGNQLLQKLYEPETIKAFEKFESLIQSNEYSNKPDVVNSYIDFLKLSKLNNVVNFFGKQIFSSIYYYGKENWMKNENNWFTSMLANSFMNKVSKLFKDASIKGYNNVDVANLLLNFSIALLTDIIERSILKPEGEFKLYFESGSEFERKIFWFKMAKGFDIYTADNLFKLISNPDAVKYINPEFLKQFKDFDDFINNSGIRKDGDYFSLFYYFGMLYAYDNNLIPEASVKSKFKFALDLKYKIPIQKNHIKSYIDNHVLSVYKLKPNSTDNENKVNNYDAERLIKYFGISNKNSCVRKKIISNVDINSYNVSQDVSFILLVNKDGNTVGRFIDVGNGIFTNLYYNNMAYETAYSHGGKEIIDKYMKNHKNIKDELDFTYKKVGGGGFSMENKDVVDFIKNQMKSFSSVFYINDFIKASRKR